MGPLSNRRTSFFLPALSKREALRLIASAPLTLASGVGGDRKHERRFEALWCEQFGSDEAIAFPSARSALTAILAGSGIGDGDEVVATGFTCEAVAEAIVASGARPVWADIGRDSLSMRPDELERKLSPRTRAVIVQHMFGMPADIDAIASIARRAGLLVVEDGCLAMGARKDGRLLGSGGDATIYSFEVSKSISAGWGGIAQINRPDLAPAVRRIRDRAGRLGRVKAARRLAQAGASAMAFSHGPARIIGYATVAMTRLGIFNDSSQHTAPDLQAKTASPSYFAAQADAHWDVLTRQLGRLESILNAHRAIGEIYAATAAGFGPLALKNLDVATAAPVRYPLIVKDPERMTEFFGRFGIVLGRWFDYAISPIPARPGSYNYSPGDCPVGEEIGRHIINLPAHPRMSDLDIAVANTALHDYLAAHPDEVDFAGDWSTR